MLYINELYIYFSVYTQKTKHYHMWYCTKFSNWHNIKYFPHKF